MRSIQELLDEISVTKRVSIEEAFDQTARVFNTDYSEDDWDNNMRTKVYELLDLSLQSKQNGNPDDYHNYAVTFARQNDFDKACKIIKSGLKRFPYNIDLLADFLEYGPESSSEDRFNECEKYWIILNEIDHKRWTWRGYSFAIDYLMARCEQYLTDDRTLILELQNISKKYIETFPTDERAYYSRFMIEQKLGNFNAAKQILEESLSKSIRAAHCALKLAEIYFSEKEYTRSLELLNRAIKDGLDQNGGLKLVNIYLLRFTIKATILMNKTELTNYQLLDELDKQTETEVKDAYLDYRIAKEMGINPSKKKTIRQYAKLLELVSGVTNETDFDDMD